MYMREFLYLGFNEDEQHRKVFDAVRILIPGTHRLFANVEFSDPNVYSRQDEHNDYLSHSVAPLTYAVTTDPISGVRDGILKRPATDPLVFHVDTANEFWQMNGSLNVHDGRGKAVPIPNNVRFYFAASHSHVGASGVAAHADRRQHLRQPDQRQPELQRAAARADRGARRVGRQGRGAAGEPLSHDRRRHARHARAGRGRVPENTGRALSARH